MRRLSGFCRNRLREEPEVVLRAGGVIADGYDAELDELRAIQNNCGEFLLQLETREKTRTGISNLKVEYNRLHGFYIEVTHAHTEKIPEDYRRRQTLKNAERYITPELKAFEEKALSAQDRALEREKFLYDELLDMLSPYIGHLQQVARSIAELDVLAAFAERALALDYVVPVFTNEAVIEIEAGRHPVVEKQVENFIANDVRLGAFSDTAAANARHYRPQHGRKIHLYAASRADCIARTLRQLRSGKKRALRPAGSDLYPHWRFR